MNSIRDSCFYLIFSPFEILFRVLEELQNFGFLFGFFFLKKIKVCFLQNSLNISIDPYWFKKASQSEKNIFAENHQPIYDVK